jgi:glycine oxidase
VNRTEVAIVGGGIIGLSLALELAAAGRQVTVFERSRAMSEASWAAAGMLAAGDPENPPALRALADYSRALYPQFLDRVTELSGVAVHIRTTQTIQGAAHIPNGYFELDALSLNTLAPGIEAGDLRFFLLEEQSLSPRDLARALPAAVRAAGVALHEESPVVDVREIGGSMQITTGQVSAKQKDWIADAVVYAAGAWTEGLIGIPATPRKGQMVEIQLSDSHQLNVVLRTPEIYLVPRGDGRTVIGATVEDAGFDKQVDSAAIAGLIESAAVLWPPVREASIVENWAGLRPGSPDELPVIGRLENCSANGASGGPSERAWVASGHFRNGILLAPGTARLLRQMMLGETPSVNPSPFRCGRFALSSVH